MKSILQLLDELLPRLYTMGGWKSLLAECDAGDGYVVLPPDYESILNL